MGYQPPKKPRTVPCEARARNGGLTVVTRPAPAGDGVNDPPMAPRMLKLFGIQDCHIRVQGKTRMGVNLARAMQAAHQRLLKVLSLIFVVFIVLYV